MTTTTEHTLSVTAGGCLTMTIISSTSLFSEIQIRVEATPARLIFSGSEVQQLGDLCATITSPLGIWHYGGLDISDVYAQETIVDLLLPLERLESGQAGPSTVALTVLGGQVTLTPGQMGTFEIAVMCLAHNLAWQEISSVEK